MKVVRSRLRDPRNCSPACETLLRVEVVRDHVHGVDRLRWRYVSSVMRQPEEDAERAINARRVVVTVHSVYIGGQCARRSGLDRILILPWSRARNKIDQALVIAIPGKRHIDHLLRTELRMHVSGIRL